MGAIIKNLGKKRKTLTISGSSPKKRTVIIKKPSKTKLADTWQDRRIDAINRKIKRRKGSHSQYIDEVGDIYKSKASTKKVYPNLWDVSVAGHIGAGEKIEEAAIRETIEEAGVEINLKGIITMDY